jgi:GDPmannose 4,6-dehydratase
VSKKALIFGITGQDGSYLLEYLLFLGYSVTGIVRPNSSMARTRIDKHQNNPRVSLLYGDILDAQRVESLIREVNPDEIYNLAAMSHVAISYQNPTLTLEANAKHVITVLDTIKNFNNDIRFYQACTSEMFGSTTPPQNISSRLFPLSPYAASKVFSFDMCNIYKQSYDLRIVCGVLFNHESHRRTSNFVTKKIIDEAIKIKKKNNSKIHLGNITSTRDWGWAPEYVVAMHYSLQRHATENFVLGTGISTSVKTFAEKAFKLLDLSFDDHYIQDSRYFRPAEVENLCADITEIQEKWNWKPKCDWNFVLENMLESELNQSEKPVDWGALVISN